MVEQFAVNEKVPSSNLGGGAYKKSGPCDRLFCEFASNDSNNKESSMFKFGSKFAFLLKQKECVI